MTKKQALQLVQAYLNEMKYAPKTLFDVYAKPSPAKVSAYEYCKLRYEDFVSAISRTSPYGVRYDCLGIKSYNTFMFSAWGIANTIVDPNETAGTYYLVLFYPTHDTVITFGMTAQGITIDSIDPLFYFLR